MDVRAPSLLLGSGLRLDGLRQCVGMDMMVIARQPVFNVAVGQITFGA